MILITKILFFILVLCILNVLKNAFLFISAWIYNTKFKISNKNLWLLAVSISYIFTIIFTGFKI